jgi:hypothetical protein
MNKEKRGLITVVMRRRGSARSWANERQVLSAIQRQFPAHELVIFGESSAGERTFSIAETIDLFSRSDVIIGSYGAGLTNLIFAANNSQTLVVQIVPEHTSQRIQCGLTSIWQIATQLQMRVCTFALLGAGFDSPFPDIPIARFSEFLAECVRRALTNNQLKFYRIGQSV